MLVKSVGIFFMSQKYAQNFRDLCEVNCVLITYHITHVFFAPDLYVENFLIYEQDNDAT